MRLIFFLIPLFFGSVHAQIDKTQIKELVKAIREANQEEDYETVIELTEFIDIDNPEYNDVLVYRMAALYFSEQLFKAKALGDIYQMYEKPSKEKLPTEQILTAINDYTTKYNFVLNNLSLTDSIDAIMDVLHEAEQSFIETYYLEAVIAKYRGDIAKAIENLNFHFEGSNDPNSASFLAALYINQQDYIAALSAINKAIEIDSLEDDFLFKRAIIYTYHNQYEKAWKDIKKIDKDTDELNLWKGKIVIKGAIEAQYAAAEGALNNLVFSEQTSDQVFKESNKLLFELFYIQERYIDAYHKLTNLIRIDHKQSAYYHERRSMLFDIDLLNRPYAELLLKDIEALLKFDPLNASYQLKQTKVLAFYSDLKRVEISAIEARIQERRASFDDYKVACTYFVYADTNKANIYASQCQYKFRKLLGQKPSVQDFRNLAASFELLKERGLSKRELSQYVKYISEAILLDPEDPALKWARATRLIQLKNWQAALEDIILIEKELITNEYYLVARAKAHFYLGDSLQAKFWVDKVLELNPYNLEVKTLVKLLE